MVQWEVRPSQNLGNIVHFLISVYLFIYLEVRQYCFSSVTRFDTFESVFAWVIFIRPQAVTGNGSHPKARTEAMRV